MATKRKNPFVEEVPRQLKVYVGPKQVAGVEEIKKVYDYTKYLLFKGSNPHATNQTLESVGCSNGFTNDRVSPVSSKENVIPPKCYQCSSNTIVVKCQDCDRMACAQCNRDCCVCNGRYCGYCSILNYDQHDVRSICLNCLPVLVQHRH